ncbi:MAG: NAD-dependent epimerase/dehydratase family protein [Chitinophagia bacterium]|nr:NAD-dependent epimerase/dehydratase family protein [Chitinophagia bacterium]
MRKILVTGANGQLGWELGQLAASFPQYEFIFTDRSVLDLSKPDTLAAIIKNIAPDAIINTAAYTAVDKAESEKELAQAVNVQSVEKMASIAFEIKIPFITFSTDYVFTGNATTPYTTETALAPLNFYGSTKADGERLSFRSKRATNLR